LCWVQLGCSRRGRARSFNRIIWFGCRLDLFISKEMQKIKVTLAYSLFVKLPLLDKAKWESVIKRDILESWHKRELILETKINKEKQKDFNKSIKQRLKTLKKDVVITASSLGLSVNHKHEHKNEQPWFVTIYFRSKHYLKIKMDIFNKYCNCINLFFYSFNFF